MRKLSFSKGKSNGSNGPETPLAGTIQIQEINEFLFTACRRYELKLADARQTTWFYAWFDGQAGQLRTSAVSVNDPKELPFGCHLKIVEAPSPVSKTFLTSNSLDGIPWAELEESTEGEVEDNMDNEFELTVFARRIS